MRVEVSGVGDKIGGDIGFLAAIDVCAKENESTEPVAADDVVVTEPAAEDESSPPGAGSLDGRGGEPADSYTSNALLELSGDDATVRYE